MRKANAKPIVRWGRKATDLLKERRIVARESGVLFFMAHITGYDIHERLYESAHSLIYRGRRHSDQLPVILKVLRHDYPPPRELARFRREYEMTLSLRIEGVIEVYALEPHHNTLVMVLEDFGGEALARLLPDRRFTFPEFLRLALRITDILGQIHQQHIVHKDINPSNIVWNPHTDDLKIIDFGIATELAHEQPEIRNPNVLEGTLAYMSPEQTGRMNRVIDYRSDFYSLGATFYHLLTGHLPFQTDDAMEMVHCHLAKMPVPPGEIIDHSPFSIQHSAFSILSAIILKLMAKNAEDRYQSAYGPRVDLQNCLDQLNATGAIEIFEIGQDDVSDTFQIPQKLYGRETEIHTLLTAFDRVSQGAAELMLVAGYSGVGKSVLVNEIHKPIGEKQGYFITGKFDQLKRNTPYSALIQAFQVLVRQLLTEPENQMKLWKEKLLKVLGSNGQIIIEVIPEVELIIGEQLAVSELPPAQAQNRFNFVFQNFVQAFTAQEHPLVIFLDDLQWADSPSLKLIDLFMSSPYTHFMLIIGAYRNNEVSNVHPLMLTLNDIQKTGITVHTIMLTPLTLKYVTQLIADTLHVLPEICTPLAELCVRKTGGNPFFLTQFLQSLYEEKALEFDVNNGSWKWELEEIRKTGITDNVVELMTGKIQKLSEKTQHIMKLAACIGNQFDLLTLALVYEHSPPDTLHDLWNALQEELIVPLDESYKYIGGEGQEFPSWEGLGVGSPSGQGWVNANLKFLHDRVQQAAYSLIKEEHKQGIHLKIGRLILEHTPEASREEKIFDIVNHLNIGRNLFTDQMRKDELVELNLMAGRRAKASAAYQAAFTYLQIGIDLLEAESWQQKYKLTLTLYVEAAEAAYLNGEFEQMEQLARVVLQHARTLLDKVKVYEVKIDACKAQNKLLEAVQTGLSVLKPLGVTFPPKPNKFHILRSFLETRFALAGKQIEDLSTLPEMTDPSKRAAMRIALSVGSSYLTVPKLMPLIVCKAVNLSIKYGNTPASAYFYAGYGLILGKFMRDIESSYRFGNLVLRLLEQLNAREFKARTVAMVNIFIRPWKEHLRETLQPLLEAYQSGLDTGDLEYAALSLLAYSCHSYFIGKELAGLEREMVSYNEVIEQLKQETARNSHKMQRQVILSLVGNADDQSLATGSGQILQQAQNTSSWGLMNKDSDEEQLLSLYRQTNDRSGFLAFYCNKLLLCYLFQEYPQAVKNAAIAEAYLDVMTPGLFIPLFHFYDSLARLVVYPEASSTEQRRIRKKVAANQKKMRKWAYHAPMNYLHKFYLVEAERARVLGTDVEAIDYYDKAIELAREHEYVNEEALANELTAKFYLAKGKGKIARAYMRDARYCYLKWGAIAKVQHLEHTYPELLMKSLRDGCRFQSGIHLTLTDTTTAETGSGVLDLAAVMKASQTLAGEIVLEKLLTRSMKIVIENAGAEKGTLLLKEDGEWIVKAKGATQTAQTSEFSKSSGVSEAFPAAIINYVARTREPVVLGDAVRESQFRQDSYILAHQPKSVLCTPLINQGKLVGILYLENNLIIEAFTPERLEVLNVLSSQAAISIENATLYTSLEQKVEARTTELLKAKETAEEAQRAAETANQAKSEFLSRMNHELRTPLNAILGYTQLLRRDKGIMDKEHEAIETIHHSGEHLLLLINDLLDLSRVESRQIELEPANIHLPEFLKYLVKMTSIQARQKGLTFSYDNPADPSTGLRTDLPAVVQVDEKRLRQILLNLLNNAIKFTVKGEITMRVTKVPEVKEAEHQSSMVTVQFSIQDTGIGIPSEHIKNIFLPFYQVGTTQTESKGIGLGLAISQQLAHLMGSELHVKSIVGQGTTFWFEISLPVVKGSRTEIASESRRTSETSLPPVILPQDVLMELLEFTKGGYISDIHTCIAKMVDSDPELIPFANRIKQLADKFQFEQITELITSSMEGIE